MDGAAVTHGDVTDSTATHLKNNMVQSYTDWAVTTLIDDNMIWI